MLESLRACWLRVQAEASRAILPARDKPAAYWVTTAVLVAGALAALALLRKR